MVLTARLQSYQFQLLTKAWDEFDIPTSQILHRLHAVLPFKYSPNNENRVPLDADMLRQEIVKGGSAVYNKLIEVLVKPGDTCDEGPPLPKLMARLVNHKVPQMYRYIWIWSLDSSVISQGCAWFTNMDDCINKGRAARRHTESLMVGHPSPVATLCIESVTPCNVITMAKRQVLYATQTLTNIERRCCSNHS